MKIRAAHALSSGQKKTKKTDKLASTSFGWNMARRSPNLPTRRPSRPEPYVNPFWENEQRARKKERGEKKMPLIVSTYVSPFSLRAAYALRSDQN